MDLLHLGSAAVWVGGLVALLSLLRATVGDDAVRVAAARRFSTVALAAVVVLAASGVGRALTELDSVSQVWSTSYGRALIVKTVLFLPLLAVGRVNRAVLGRASARLERTVLIELAVLAGDRRRRRRAHRSAARERGSAEGAEVDRRLFAAGCAGVGVGVVAPALSSVTGQLEEARCILERGEPTWRPPVPASLGQPAAGRDRTRGADDAAERERAEPSGPTTVVHATILRCG